MRGIADDLQVTERDVRAGMISERAASAQVERGEKWLEGLGKRRESPGFAEEVFEVNKALVGLRAAINQRGWRAKAIRLLWIPARASTSTALTKEETAANLLAIAHLRSQRRLESATARPVRVEDELIKPRPLMKKSIEVLRINQDMGYAVRRGRARVEVPYELLIGGERACTGSKRYVMRQAHWAAMLDVMGRMPFREALFTSGLSHHQRSHHLYQLRKEKRQQAPKPPRPRKGTPREHKGRHGDRKMRAILSTMLGNRLLPASRWIDIRYTVGPGAFRYQDAQLSVGGRQLTGPGAFAVVVDETTGEATKVELGRATLGRLAEAQESGQQPAGEHQPADLRRLSGGGEGIDQDADDGDGHGNG